MSFGERAEHLNQLSHTIATKLPKTARWVQRLAETIMLPNVTLEEVSADLKDVFDTFRIEYIGDDRNANYRESCFDEFTKLFKTMIKKIPTKTAQTLEGLLPAFATGNQTLDNIAEIHQALVASEDLTEKRRYYGLCFEYLVFIEGLYDENMRILYAIKKAIDGNKVEYEKIEEKSLCDFRSDLPSVFFEGYNNRLRNAIAHARFAFNDNTQKMTFKDRKGKSQPEFCETLSIQEFVVKYYGKVDNLCRLCNQYMLLLGIMEFVHSPQPFGKQTFRLE